MIIQNIGDLLPKSFDAKIRYVNLRETLKSCREFVFITVLLALINSNHLERKSYQFLLLLEYLSIVVAEFSAQLIYLFIFSGYSGLSDYVTFSHFQGYKVQR